MARASSSGCSAALRVMVGCAPGVSKVPPNTQLRSQRLRVKKCTDRPTPEQGPHHKPLPLLVAPVRKQAGDGLRCGEQIGDAYVLVWGVGDLHVAGAVHHARYPAEADEEPHVRAVGDALDGGPLARHSLVRTLHGLADRGVGWDLGWGELAAEPPQLRRVLAQPRVAFGDRRDSVGDEVSEGSDLLAGDQAYAPLRDERLGDGRGPVARPHDPDVDRHLVTHAIVERVAQGFVALALQLAQVLEDGYKLLQGRDALVAHGGV